MIREETVFILGAGASKPYGYPTAKELKLFICHEFNCNELFLGSWTRQGEEFIKNFASSPVESIDLFLSRNPKYLDIGKNIIAYAIGHYEEKAVSKKIEDSEDWYSYLFNEMTRDIYDHNKIDEFGKNRVTFITFNYDRSLEHFFYEKLHSSFTEVDSRQLKSFATSLRIKHVYGQIMRLPWQIEIGESLDDMLRASWLPYQGKVDSVPYGQIKSCTSWKEYSDNLKIVNPERAIDEQVKDIRNHIKAAKKIYFLGFGYQPENIEILGLSDILSEAHSIWGTGIGFEAEEIEHRKSLMTNKDIEFFNPKEFNIEPRANCKTLLRKYLNYKTSFYR